MALFCKNMPPLVSYLVITRNRCADLREALRSVLAQAYDQKEIVVVDNDSKDETARLFDSEFKTSNVKYVKSGSNLGVCGGRNLGLQHVHGEIVITLDDDAVLRDERATARIVERFGMDKGIGVLAFKILDYWRGSVEKAAFPSKNKNLDSSKEFETTWFIGAGHAILRAVYERAGTYRDFYPYGHEELDLSLRIIESGYRIVYFPDVQVFHKKIETRRLLMNSSFQTLQLFNRIKVAMYNLPVQFVLTTAAVRSIQVLITMRGNVLPILESLWKVATNYPSICHERKVLSKATIKKVLRMKGPIIY